MRLLIALLFFLLSSFYVLTVHRRDYTLAPYISGILVGILTLPIALLLRLDFFNSDKYLLHSFSYFFLYFFLPSIIGLILYFLLNLKNFEPKTAPLALAGIWTSFLVFVAYEISKIPDSMLYIVFFITYTFSVLAFDLLTTLFYKTPKWVLLLGSYFLTLPLMFVSTFTFTLWLYKHSPLIYIGIPTFFSLVFLATIIVLKRAQKRKDEEVDSYLHDSNVNKSFVI